MINYTITKKQKKCGPQSHKKAVNRNQHSDGLNADISKQKYKRNYYKHSLRIQRKDMRRIKQKYGIKELTKRGKFLGRKNNFK